MKVYVLTRGEYSDYRVLGVCSSKEIADDISRLEGENGWGYSVQVEEYEVDEFSSRIKSGEKTYTLGMWTHDGSVEYCNESMFDDPSDIRIVSGYVINGQPLNKICGAVIAKSKDHAIKIFSDYRRRIIAEGKLEDIQ